MGGESVIGPVNTILVLIQAVFDQNDWRGLRLQTSEGAHLRLGAKNWCYEPRTWWATDATRRGMVKSRLLRHFARMNDLSQHFPATPVPGPTRRSGRCSGKLPTAAPYSQAAVAEKPPGTNSQAIPFLLLHKLRHKLRQNNRVTNMLSQQFF